MAWSSLHQENLPRPLGKWPFPKIETFRNCTERGTTVLGNPQAGQNSVHAVWKDMQPKVS